MPGQAGANGAGGDDGEERLYEHGAVADGTAEGFARELFDAGARGCDGMEAGDCAAGDDDKKHRP